MRLIDADAFEESTREHCTDSFADLWCELIRRQPTVEVKEQIIRELESTRYVNCPYPQCDEMYHAWNEAFDAMEKVVKQF